MHRENAMWTKFRSGPVFSVCQVSEQIFLRIKYLSVNVLVRNVNTCPELEQTFPLLLDQ